MAFRDPLSPSAGGTASQRAATPAEECHAGASGPADQRQRLFNHAIAESLVAAAPPPAADQFDAVEVFRRKVDEATFRIADVTIAFTLLVLLSPIMISCWLLVMMSGPGPAVFTHRRIGKGGQEFDCFKFRTMVNGAEAMLGPLMAECNEARSEWTTAQKLKRDPRVTLIGGVLRRFSLDELPQLFNVLLGEMSMVGPRPIVKEEIARYDGFFSDYCSVKPGLTGLWQVSGRNSLPYEQRVRLDAHYARSRSMWTYVVILWRTVPVVILGRGC